MTLWNICCARFLWSVFNFYLLHAYFEIILLFTNAFIMKLSRWAKSRTLKIVFLNIQGLTSEKRTRDKNWYLKQENSNFDVVGLTETNEAVGEEIRINVNTSFNFPRPKHGKATLGSGVLPIIITPNIAKGITIKPSPNSD